MPVLVHDELTEMTLCNPVPHAVAVHNVGGHKTGLATTVDTVIFEVNDPESAAWPVRFQPTSASQTGGSVADQLSRPRRIAFTLPRRDFSSRRRSRAARVGRVALRSLGTVAAR